VKYVIRIPANENLERDIAELLTRPVGRPSHKPVVWYKSFLYQAASWSTARRVMAKVEFHFGELFPRVVFIVASLEADSRAVVRFYNKRGTAEQWIKEGCQRHMRMPYLCQVEMWIKEGKQAVKMTRLSCHRFRSNEVRLWLSVIAYNLGNPVAASGAAKEDRRLVADEPTAFGLYSRSIGSKTEILAETGNRRQGGGGPRIWEPMKPGNGVTPR
jgi:hypothetical protein